MNPAPLGWCVSAVSRIARAECHPHQTLLDSFLDFLDLDFGKATDLEEVLAVLCMNSLLQYQSVQVHDAVQRFSWNAFAGVRDVDDDPGGSGQR